MHWLTAWSVRGAGMVVSVVVLRGTIVTGREKISHRERNLRVGTL